MFYFVYVIENLDNEVYIGYTSDLTKRLHEHNRGSTFSTKHSKSWRVVYFEGCLNKNDALRREKYFKTSQGRRLLKRRLKEYFYLRRVSTTG